jgi:hypothetical protein
MAIVDWGGETIAKNASIVGRIGEQPEDVAEVALAINAE